MSEWYDRRSKTKVRKTMRKQLIKAAFTLLCVLGLLAGKERNTAYAKEEKPADMELRPLFAEEQDAGSSS